MENNIIIQENFLWIPIAKKQEKTLLSLYDGEEKKLEFMIPVRSTGTEHAYIWDFYAPIPVSGWRGRTLTLKGEMPRAFWKAVKQMPYGEVHKEDIRKAPEESRPKVHFTAQTGWINDPNGLVYANGTYHLYFQYNPFDTEWENMSWGHAVSRDLLHWEQQESVMYPDENGMMFSGCGLINERGLLGLPKDTLLFFYSAAGGANAWGKDKEYTQRIAYSTDGGKTFHKTDKGMIPTINKENRDPKIFWHNSSRAYIMVLWLKENLFAILRSKDLEHWDISQTLELEGAWECPDLLELSVENGGKKWIFWSADGYYFVGDFDGYTFQTDGIRKEAYATKIPYAAQTYYNINDRTVSIPWLRTLNEGRNYRGMMGLPRELSLVEQNGVLLLKQTLVSEWKEQRQEVYHAECDREGCSYRQEQEVALEVITRMIDTEHVTWKIYNTDISYDRSTGLLCCDGHTVSVGPEIFEISILADESILEISGDDGIITAVFEIKNDKMQGDIDVLSDGMADISIYEMP